MVTFSSHLTTSSPYKPAGQSHFLPHITSSEYDATARDITATCNHAHLGTWSIDVKYLTEIWSSHMSLENHKWSENAPEAISNGLKIFLGACPQKYYFNLKLFTKPFLSSPFLPYPYRKGLGTKLMGYRVASSVYI